MTKKVSPEEEERLLEIEQVVSVMRTENGRKLMHRFIKMSGQFRASYNPHAPANDIYFREGERNMGLQIIAELNDCAPDLYSKMMKESRNVI